MTKIIDVDGREIKQHKSTDFPPMRKAGLLAAQLLDYITEFVVPGESTGHLDKLCYDFIKRYNAIPAPLNYRVGDLVYPKSICTSINHVICHGIPDDARKLKNGDIINIDVTVIVDGWHGDTSRMYLVGDKVSVLAKRLVQVTYDAMMASIELVRPGLHLGDIGACIQEIAHDNRFSVVRDFTGHGIGRTFHAPPHVFHYGEKGTGPILQEGMFLTIEPMLNAGTWKTKILSDGWTAVTRDRKLSAQFEHTLAVTHDGFEIFTLSPNGYKAPPYQV